MTSKGVKREDEEDYHRAHRCWGLQRLTRCEFHPYQRSVDNLQRAAANTLPAIPPPLSNNVPVVQSSLHTVYILYLYLSMTQDIHTYMMEDILPTDMLGDILQTYMTQPDTMQGILTEIMDIMVIIQEDILLS
ncbi:hypothetical protein PAMP_023030 [Pampus punctatissimus]